MGRKLKAPSKETLKYLLQVKTQADIARESGVTEAAVSNWKRRYGLQDLETYDRSRSKPDRATLLELTSKHYDKDIAKMYGVSTSLVYQWRRSYSLPSHKTYRPENPVIYCACGCGKTLRKFRDDGRSGMTAREFLIGHGRRGRFSMDKPLIDQLIFKPTITNLAALDRSPGDPTPEEIRQRCKEIQNRWTVSDERERRTGSRDKPKPTVQEVHEQDDQTPLVVNMMHFSSGHPPEDWREGLPPG